VVTTKQFFKVTPGLAWRVNDQLAVGATINLDYQSLALYTPAYALPQNQVFGWGVSLGAVWKPNEQWQVGAAFSSRQDMGDFDWNTTAGRFSLAMDAPQSFAVGVAWRPRRGTLVEFDVKHIGFSSVLDSIAVSRPPGYSGPIPAQLNFGWSDQTVFALAVQQDIGELTQLRAGFNYGSSPIGEEDVNSNIGSLAVVEKHLAIGLTRRLGQRAYGSLSYVHAFSNSITSSVPPFNTIELKQNIVNFQVTYQH
jgi:long-chain fatty acid transport protein